MSLSETVEAYYFAADKKTELSSLFEEFPDIFGEKALVPVNFTLLMEDRANELRANKLELIYKSHGASSIASTVPPLNRKLTSQKASVRKELSKALLCDIMINKENYQIFYTLENCQDEEENQKIWIFTDDNNVLKGPFSSDKMQVLFETGFVKPSYAVKKKFDSEFTTMANLMRKFIKMSLLNKIEKGALVDSLLKSSKKIKSYLNHISGEEQPCDVKAWVDAIFKKNYTKQSSLKSSATVSTKDSMSVSVDSDSSNQIIKRVAISFNKPKICVDEPVNQKLVKASSGFGKTFNKLWEDDSSDKKTLTRKAHKPKDYPTLTAAPKPKVAPKPTVAPKSQEAPNQTAENTSDFKHEFDSFMGKKRRKNNKKKNSQEEEGYTLK